MPLTPTVVGSGQADRQDSCEEKAGPSYWASTSPEPTSSQEPQPGGQALRLASLGCGQRAEGQAQQGQNGGKQPRSSFRNTHYTIHSIHWTCLSPPGSGANWGTRGARGAFSPTANCVG